jgi:hypothetical protein
MYNLILLTLIILAMIPSVVVIFLGIYWLINILIEERNEKFRRP